MTELCTFRAASYATHVAAGGTPLEWIEGGGPRGLNFAAHMAYGGKLRDWLEAELPLPKIGGGAITTPTQHPLGPPVVSGGAISVPIYLNQPTRINRYVRDITLERFVINRLFGTPVGGVAGGAVLFDVVQSNDLYLNTDLQMIPPGSEFPIITSQEQVPSIAVPEKWGAKTYMLDEARDRNDATRLGNEMRRLGNTFVRKVNQRCMGIVLAAVTANSRTVSGHNWGTATLYGSTPTSPSQTPNADLTSIQSQGETEEMGISYDTILWNPAQSAAFRNVYQGQAAQVLADNGFREAYASNRIAAGTAFAVASGQLGEYRVEKALGTEAWREPKYELTWIQMSTRILMLVNNPFAILELTGLAG